MVGQWSARSWFGVPTPRRQPWRRRPGLRLRKRHGQQCDGEPTAQPLLPATETRIATSVRVHRRTMGRWSWRFAIIDACHFAASPALACLLFVPSLHAPRAPPRADRRMVLLVSIDGLPADVVGSGGCPRSTPSPAPALRAAWLNPSLPHADLPNPHTSPPACARIATASSTSNIRGPPVNPAASSPARPVRATSRWWAASRSGSPATPRRDRAPPCSGRAPKSRSPARRPRHWKRFDGGLRCRRGSTRLAWYRSCRTGATAALVTPVRHGAVRRRLACRRHASLAAGDAGAD